MRKQTIGNFVSEEHHKFYGRPWCLGRDHFQYLVDRGLSKDHNFLDVGCGAMRTGIWVAQYLNSGRYYGVEAHLDSLGAAEFYEIPLNGLEEKMPKLLQSDSFEFDHWGVKFERIFAFSLFDHLDNALKLVALKSCLDVLSGDAIIIIAPRLPLDESILNNEFGLKVINHETRKSLFLNSYIHWYELKRINQ